MSHALETPRRCHVNAHALAGGADSSQHSRRMETSAFLSCTLDVDGRKKKSHEVDFLKAAFFHRRCGKIGPHAALSDVQHLKALKATRQRSESESLLSQSTGRAEVRVRRVETVFGCKYSSGWLGLAAPLTHATTTVYTTERKTRASTKFINPFKVLIYSRNNSPGSHLFRSVLASDASMGLLFVFVHFGASLSHK